MLAYTPSLTIGERQCLTQCVGRRRGSDDEEGLLRPRLVGALIEDELSCHGGERAEFQSAAFTREEGVVLQHLNRTLICQCRSSRSSYLNTLDTRFDFDIASHRRCIP